MHKIFWDNPYERTWETTVSFLREDEFVPAHTIAFSFSGGQESDRAWVNGLEILGSRMDGPLIYYTLPQDHGLSLGDKITLTIDWDRRYRLMRLHFAAELILELVTRTRPLEKVGAHIAPGKARIDFRSDENISALFPEILEAYNAIIAQDLPIETGFTDVETQRRYWKINGFAQVPCGGTHVRSTGEVGPVTLKRARPGKSVERIEIRLEEQL